MPHTRSVNKIYQDLLVSITHTIFSSADRKAFFKTVLGDIGEKTKSSRVYIFNRSSDGFWTNTFEWCAEDIEPVIDILPIMDESIEPFKYFFEQIISGEGHVYDDISLMPKEPYEFLADQGILSIFAMPLYENNRVSAFFGFDICKHPVRWAPETIDIFTAMGNLLSSAIGHFQIKETLESQKQEFQSLLDNFPNPVYIADMETHAVLFCNKIIRDMLDEKSILGQLCYKAFQNFDAPCSFCTNDRLAKGESPISWTHQNLHVDRDFQVTDCCVQWQGHAKARLTVAQDITDSLEAKRNEVLAQETNITKNAILANISHELRTPLNAITGLTRLARKQSKEPMTDTYLANIQAATVTLGTLVNNLLDYTSIDTKELELNPVPFNFYAMTQNISNTFSFAAKEKNISFQCHIDDTLPQTFIGDVAHITQIIMNIVSNAIKFTSQGGVTLSYRLHETNDTQNIIRIQIKDTGIGMKDVETKELFQAFSQVDTSLTRIHGGAGIGLAVACKLIHLMNGSITAESVHGEGSTFTVLLPFVLHDASASDIASHAFETKSLHGCRILVTEDNTINQLITKEILEQAGSFVDIAANGEQALAMLENARYDLVLMDIQMPVMDGITAAKCIRQKYNSDQLPIIALTAHSQPSDRVKSLQAGMQDHLTKPINPEIFLHTLQKWILSPLA